MPTGKSSKSVKNKRVDAFLRNEKRWSAEMAELRELALSTGVTEDLKWGNPCYTLDNSNVFLIHGFKEYFAILFFKGALMKDPKKLLIRQTENVQSSRQLRFTSIDEVAKLHKVIKGYLEEAISIEEAGLEFAFVKSAEQPLPAEIEKKLKKIPGLLPAFKKLTPGRRRAYVLHFTAAKQEKTVDSRIEKATPAILAGKGLNE